MKIEDFMDTVKQIEKFYGKEMMDEQKKIWYENLKNMKTERFRYLVANLYKTSKFMPKLADIFEMNMTIKSTEKKDEVNQQHCNKCNDTGYIIYKQIIKNGDKDVIYDYGAICTCNRKKQYKGWELSDERYRSKYYTPLATELGL